MFNETCCLLCLESSKDQIDLDCTDGFDLNGREVIELHFKEELDMMTQIEIKFICRKCWDLVETFHKFYEHVKQVHKEAANTLKSVTLEKDNFEIKEEINQNDDAQIELKRRRGRPRRQKAPETVEVLCEPAIPLKECQVKIEELILPPTIDSKDIYNSAEIVSEPLEVKDETSPEDFVDNFNCFDGENSRSVSSTSVNSESQEDDEKPKRRKLKTKKSTKPYNKKRHKTSDHDEFIAQHFKLTCSLCEKTINDFRELKIHYRQVHQTNGYAKCCGKKLYNRGVLVDHIHFHNNPEYFKCQLCEKVLCDRSNLESHLQHFHDSKERTTYKCEICSKCFYRRKVLARHNLIHAPEEERNVKCTQCEKTFCNQYTMKQHLNLSHLNLYAKICDICGKSLNGKDAFQRHQEEHAGVQRTLERCKLCNIELKTKYGLARHMKTMHTEQYQTPQVCTVCSKVSPTLRAHKSHMEYMHSGKKHICNVCDKTFKLPKCLREHMATHTGETLYTCTFCPQTFNSKSNMYAHRKRKHPKEWSEKCSKRIISTGMVQQAQNELMPMAIVKMFNETCCLLCLESSKDQIDLDCKDGFGLNGREVIELHFKEELDMMTQIEIKFICRKCWDLVETFHKFYEHVKQVHKEAANTLKSVTLEKDNFEIKEEIIQNDDAQIEPKRRRGRPRRQKAPETVEVLCEPAIPLKECQVKIEELILPPTIDSKDIYNSTEIISEALEVKDESLPEDFMDNSISAESSDSDEKDSEDEDQPSQRRSRKIKNKSKGVNKKTAESDEYIAKKNFKFTCCICQIPLQHFKHLKSHFRKEHQTSGYVLCCGKKLPERRLLIDHIHFHEDPDYFKCKHCGKRMSEQRSLDLHLQYAHGNRERVHRCSICSKGFFRASCLKQHYNTHVTEDQKTVPCLECGKTFPDDVELRKHMRLTHLNVYAKICDICGISIKGRDALERHQAEHAGVPRKLIKCDLCDAGLTTKYGLARHMKTMHTEEYQTPQVCPICSKLSPSLQAHNNHIKYMHSLQRKHVCKLCDKAFKRLTDFKEHMATHTGEALYTCSFCPQTFKSNANMYSHRKKKHAKEWAEQCALKKSLAVPLKKAIATDQ
ncbi:zinc finger protein 845-like [Zeugodacus cucurbitae]|uniref:zinc finger protein 845-like n=1 Tax=Zeugodacus cucurbitae TaxID=28588 RepID=UPI0023D960A0|nr:zinc finger protein 845-like [Zeugodacus cucurbitae]